jgi:hypothetical protein
MSVTSGGWRSRLFGDGAEAKPLDAATALKAEQYLLRDLRVKMENGVGVIVPPLHHRVVTLTLNLDPAKSELRDAQKELHRVIRGLENQFEPTPSGLGVTLGWGLPYFRRFVPGPSSHYLPVDNRASKAAGKTTLAILDAIRFPSDPEDVILEENDVAVLLRSDSVENIEEGARALFDPELDFWKQTSIREGFIGGDGIGLPKQLALEAGIPGAEKIPDGAQMFLGFTSSQKAALGSDMIANFETIPGLTDQWPDGYFRCGAAMHLAHLFEDVDVWYNSHDYKARVERSFRPGLEVAPGTQTVNEGPSAVEVESEVVSDLKQHGIVGHSASLQPVTRIATDLIDNYGNFYPAGSAIPNRADFNTLDNPFRWSADPKRDQWSDKPRPGLHFVVFVPSSDAFHRARSAMDGVYPDGTKLDIAPRHKNQGMNAVLHTTHRQNFLVPPRSHRSFPLAELA